MISHVTLYNLANGLGSAAMLVVVLYHIVAVNAKYVARGGEGVVVGAAL
jgi:hypothetical protein